jgi:hypothetical protein
LILASNGSARDAVVIGVGLAALVLLVFLRNWKTTLFAAIAVPPVLCAMVLVLYVLSSLIFQLPLVLIVLPCLLALFRHGPRGVRRNTQAVPSLVSTAR